MVFAGRAAEKIEQTIPFISYGTTRANLEDYEDLETWKNEGRKRIMNEIKRRDEKFYDQWCHHKG